MQILDCVSSGMSQECLHFEEATELFHESILTVFVTTSGTQMRVRDSSATRIFF